MYTVRGWPEVGVVGLGWGGGWGCGGVGGGVQRPFRSRKTTSPDSPTSSTQKTRRVKFIKWTTPPPHHNTSTTNNTAIHVYPPMEQTYTRLSSFSLKGLSPSARKPKGKERKTVWSLQRERFQTAQSRHYILATRIRPFLPGQWMGDRAGPRQSDGPARIQWPVFSQANGQGVGLSHDVWAVSEYTVLYKVLVRDFFYLFFLPE